MEDLVESRFVRILAAAAAALGFWAALRFTASDRCIPLTPPESLWMPRGATTCDLPMEGLSPTNRK